MESLFSLLETERIGRKRGRAVVVHSASCGADGPPSESFYAIGWPKGDGRRGAIESK